MAMVTEEAAFGSRIAGSPVPPSPDGELIERRSPGDPDRVVARFGEATPSEIERAVAAARATQPGWAALHPGQRSEILHRAARLLEARRDDLVAWEIAESGMTLGLAELHAGWCVEVLDFYAGLARALSGRTVALGGDKLGLVVPEAHEVVAALGPWNFPLSELVWKVAPALAAGSAVVSKPSEMTPVTSLILDEVLTEAGVPAGLTSVLVGGRDVGSRLVNHPDVSLVTLTGGRATGRAVVAATAENLTPTVMELGGKSPVVVLPGADTEKAAAIIGDAVSFRTGQQCICPSRVVVVGGRERRDEIAEAVHTRLASLTCGPPESADTDLGPVISPDHAASLRSVMNQARERGVTVLGGEALDGAFVSPAVLIPSDSEDPTLTEELFGPYTAVQSSPDVSAAIDAANRTRYGLAAGIVSGGDLATALNVARRVRGGSVWIDDWGTIELELPFGGIGDSGFGRELGIEGLEAFVRWKSIHLLHQDGEGI